MILFPPSFFRFFLFVILHLQTCPFAILVIVLQGNLVLQVFKSKQVCVSFSYAVIPQDNLKEKDIFGVTVRSQNNVIISHFPHIIQIP